MRNTLGEQIKRTDKMRAMVEEEFRGCGEQLIREVAALRIALLDNGLATINSHGGFVYPVPRVMAG